KKKSGGRIEGLFLEEISPGQWRVMLQSRGRCASGLGLEALDAEGKSTGITLKLEKRMPEKGQWMASLNVTEPAAKILEKIGAIPLPPYIQKARKLDHTDSGVAADKIDYQTVYARQTGAVAAPTAGLHFTPEVFTELTGRAIANAFLTLHVGLGTFLPVQTQHLEDHPMHEEWFTIPESTFGAIRAQRARGGRIVSVGTTSVRALESAAEKILGKEKSIDSITGSTDLLIAPGYQFQLTDALITNFHLPRSTLIALVAALVGLEKLKSLYEIAVQEKYRFFSYGDAMLILP
ncbi:MAG TPA: tRNA preQ1(34) S-adenosylmethionine ribosyltransferase-isomerase QueA, partial [Phycisphaerae bacterium]|nr:tRNA preQ1(34) S-adenosylmethionine ribosyltransferase-isomerase QueA [Phycisphaerae bacterium]